MTSRGWLPELLVPAGCPDSLRAAVQNGADAVYLGAAVFSARAQARNFNADELENAVDYAHLRGVKVYLAMNTLVSDDELPKAADLAGECLGMGVDALVIQDLGLAAEIRRRHPEARLHASTQMTTLTSGDAACLEAAGFVRVVLARELSLAEIARIKDCCGIELEIFVHGALCISYSGQCLFSSMLGGRSGNRGRCAQPCRFKFRLSDMEKDSGYLMSPADLCLLKHLPEILKTGVHSLKIEGRMKSPAYVAAVTGVYRKHLDRAGNCSLDGSGYSVDEDDMRLLKQVFNRGGFDDSYLTGAPAVRVARPEKQSNWGLRLGKVIRYEGSSGVIELVAESNIGIGDKIEVWNGDDDSPWGKVDIIQIKDNVSGKWINVKTAPEGCGIRVGTVRGAVGCGDMVTKTYDRALELQLLDEIAGKEKKPGPRPINAVLKLIPGKAIRLEFTDVWTGIAFAASGAILPETGCRPDIPATWNAVNAVGNAVGQSCRYDNISKLGGTPYHIASLVIDSGQALIPVLPVAALNAMRREAVDGLTFCLKRTWKKSSERGTMPVIRQNSPDVTGNKITRNKNLRRFRLTAFFQGIPQDAALASLPVDRVYIPISCANDDKAAEFANKCRELSREVFVWTPPAAREAHHLLLDNILSGKTLLRPDGILAGSTGAMMKTVLHAADIVGSGLQVIADYGVHTFNSHTLRFLYYSGVAGATLSPELSSGLIDRMAVPAAGFELEALVYGRIHLMQSAYCPVKLVAQKRCGRVNHLVDGKGAVFPLFCDGTECRGIVLNSVPLFFKDVWEELDTSPVTSLRMIFTVENPERIAKIASWFASQGGGCRLQAEPPSIIEKEGFTKGHYRRRIPWK